MTDRQLEILAAWWHAKGSAKRAAMVLGIGHQPVMNAMYHMRRQAGVTNNIDLVMRHMDRIQGINVASVRR